MTPEEAIYVIKEYKPILGFEKYREALNVAIETLEEIQHYRAIGTVEECLRAMEKQKPKEPDYEGDGFDDKGELIYDTWICPNCGKKYEVDYNDCKYCPKCGQGILMEDIND